MHRSTNPTLSYITQVILYENGKVGEEWQMIWPTWESQELEALGSLESRGEAKG